MVHVFAHERLSITRLRSGHDVGVMKGQLVLLCKVHGLRMGTQRFAPVGFEARKVCLNACSGATICVLPSHHRG